MSASDRCNICGNACDDTSMHTADCPVAVAARQEAQDKQKLRDAVRRAALALAVAKLAAFVHPQPHTGEVTATEAVEAIVQAAVEATR